MTRDPPSPARATLENCYGKEEKGPIITGEESFFQTQNIEIYLPQRTRGEQSCACRSPAYAKVPKQDNAYKK